MRFMQPFILLTGRASVAWLGVLAVLVVSILMVGFSQPDKFISAYVNVPFMAAFLFSASAGWLFGAVVQEFQHTTFALFLPSVRSRLALGFMVTGLVVNFVITLLVVSTSTVPQNPMVLFAVGMSTYCFISTLLVSSSTWMGTLGVLLVVTVLIRSAEIAEIVNAHPWLCLLTSALFIVFCLMTVFSLSNFRVQPSRLVTPFPGRFSLDRTGQYKKKQMLKAGPVKSKWRTGYMGGNSWRWLRAALYETYGAHFIKSLSKSVVRAWGVAVIILLSAWLDRGELSFGNALALSINDALLRSPFQPEFGDNGGPYPLVMMLIASIGVVTAMFSTVALNGNLFYPLSRLQRATVNFRGGLIDTGIFLFIITPLLLVIAYWTGLSAGYPVRFDFMPFFFRVMMLTLIMMPVAYMGRLYLQEASWRKTENTVVAVGFGIVGFVVFVSLLTAIFGGLFDHPGLELVTLVLLFLVSRVLYWRSLTKYYATADLT